MSNIKISYLHQKICDAARMFAIIIKPLVTLEKRLNRLIPPPTHTHHGNIDNEDDFERLCSLYIIKAISDHLHVCINYNLLVSTDNKKRKELIDLYSSYKYYAFLQRYNLFAVFTSIFCCIVVIKMNIKTYLLEKHRYTCINQSYQGEFFLSDKYKFDVYEC